MTNLTLQMIANLVNAGAVYTYIPDQPCYYCGKPIIRVWQPTPSCDDHIPDEEPCYFSFCMDLDEFAQFLRLTNSH